jgi:hypothetical protein
MSDTYITGGKIKTEEQNPITLHIENADSVFNDAEGDPVVVGTSAASDGTSNFATRRDHKHAIDTTELDARYLQDITGESIGDLDDIDDTGKDTDKILKYNAVSGNWEIADDEDTTYSAGDFNHDDLANIPVSDHIDWTVSQTPTVIHADNYTDTTYTSSDFDHNSLTNTHDLTSDIDHGSIAGLTDDDHAQYPLLVGRAGGQTIKGGTAVTDILKLQGTTGNGTLTSPAIQLLTGNSGATTAVTVLNIGNVGIGTTEPGYKLDVNGVTRIQGGYTGNESQLLINGQSGGWNAGLTFGSTNTNYRGHFKFYVATGDLQYQTSTNGTDYSNAMRIASTGNVGIGTTDPTNLLSLGGNSARKFWLERHTTSNSAGNTLTITAGGATAGATDKAGGALILQGGLSTGSAESGVTIQGCVAGAGGTADRTQTTAIQVLGNKIGFYGVTPVVRPTALTPTGTYTLDTGDAGSDTEITLMRTRINELEAKLQSLGLLT